MSRPDILSQAAIALLLAATMSVASVAAQSISEARVAFPDPTGASVGTAVLTQTPDDLLMIIDMRDLPSGKRGVHLHVVGGCEVAGGFESAGAHAAPAGTGHGHDVAAGPYAGEITNQFVGGDGGLRAEMLTAAVTPGAGATLVRDRGGSALMIHEGLAGHGPPPFVAAGSWRKRAMVSGITTFVTFKVPADALEEFKAEWLTDAAVIAKQPGQKGGNLYQRIGGDGQQEFVNVAHWENEDALASALKAALLEQRRQGRDQALIFQRLGVLVSVQNYRVEVPY